MPSFPECVSWLAVGLTECVAIVTLNIITIIVFIENRYLRKRSTYLVINLAIADMFVGRIATYGLFYMVGAKCNIWKDHSIAIESLLGHVLYALLLLFPCCSITNITAISVERLHATLRPFRHRVIKKIVYGVVIGVVWITAGLLSIAETVLIQFKAGKYFRYTLFLRISFFAVCLLVICVSYTSVVIKVHCGAQPRHHGAATRERKLTMTLLIVTVVSLLLYMPFIIWWYLFLISRNKIVSSLSESSIFHLEKAIVVLYYASSLVNPILYAIRMPEYRSAVVALFRLGRKKQRQAAVLPLHNL